MGCQWTEAEIGYCLPKCPAESQSWKTQAKYILDDSGWAREVRAEEAIFLLLY